MSKPLPSAPDIEQTLLGALMIPEQSESEKITNIKKDYFSLLKHQLIFDAIQNLSSNNLPVDIVSVSQSLKDKNQHSQIGGDTYLSECSNRSLSSGNIDYLISVLKEKHLQRKLIMFGQRLVNAGFTGNLTAGELISNSQKYFADLYQKLSPANGNDHSKYHFTAFELAITIFPEHKFIIPGILPEGLTILAGKPKIGKSWMCLDFAVAVSMGVKTLDKIEIPRGVSLYLALEDPPRRLKSRLYNYIQQGLSSTDCHFITEWKRLDKGGLENLKSWVECNPDVRLIIIDTLARIRSSISKNANLYLEDYEAISGLKKLADDYHIGIVLVHHLRKSLADDPLDMISGTTGLSGCADSILILDRSRGRSDATLHITGRDVEEQELALNFDRDKKKWILLGNAADYQRSIERQQIIDVISNADNPLSPSDIAKALGKESYNIKKLLPALLEEGTVKKEGYGKYLLA